MAELAAEDPRFVGGYRLLSRLGVGGMGRVFLARSEGGRTVAVKLVKEDLATESEFRVRFRQEVEAAGRVGGTWTAPVLDADTEAKTPWVATGYIAGPSLEHIVSGDVQGGGHGPLPPESVEILAYGLASALVDIHHAGLVHRDLKPSNVLLTIDGPRVIDFGIARALESVSEATLTRTGMVVGSPAYMSPEQLRGEGLGAAADVFSMGSVLAYAATGRAPFGNGSGTGGVHAVMFRVAAEEPDLRGVPEPLRELILSCLAKSPSARPTPSEVVAQVRPERTDGAVPPWLPAGLLADLGRRAVKLLDTDTPPDGSRARTGWPDTGARAASDPPAEDDVAQPPAELSAPPADSAPAEEPEPLTTQLPSGAHAPTPSGSETTGQPPGSDGTEAGAPARATTGPNTPSPGTGSATGVPLPGSAAPPPDPVDPGTRYGPVGPDGRVGYDDEPPAAAGESAPPGRRRSGKRLLLTLCAAAAVLGAALYAGFTATGNANLPFTGAGQSAEHSADSEKDASDVPPEFLGTWVGPVELGGGSTGGYRKFVVSQGNVGEVVVDSVSLGKKYSCWSDGRLIEASTAGGLRLDTKVVRSLPEGRCTALGEHTLRLDDNGNLRWRAASRSGVLKRVDRPQHLAARYLGEWERPLPNGGRQRLTVLRDSVRDGGVQLVSTGSERCVAKAEVFSPGNSGEPLRLAPPALDEGRSDAACRPGTSSELTVQGEQLKRSFPDGTSRVYTR